jgi:endoglucanase
LDTKETLFALSVSSGPAGFENGAAALAAELLKPLVGEVKTDRLGNVLARFNCDGAPDTGKPLVLLDAHLDEVGIIVTGGDKGFHTFRTLGSIDPRILPACEFSLLTDPVTPSVVGCLPPHLIEKGKEDKAQKIQDLYLDTGGVYVPAGTPGVFARTPFAMGSVVSGKAFDNRAGFTAILRALELIDRDALGVDLVVCGSVQEEVGGWGALVANYGIVPDIAIVVDVTYGAAPDTPSLDAHKLGGGVCINKGPDCNRALAEKLTEIARAKEIPYQIEITSGMSRTNATGIQTVRGGVCTAVLSIPLRYMHTPSETLNPEDIESCARLIREWVMGL